MAVISTILGAIGAAFGAIASAVSSAAAAIGGVFGATAATGAAAGITTAGTSSSIIGAATSGAFAGAAAAGTVGVSTGLTVGGILAGIGLTAATAAGLGIMYKSSRASSAAQVAQSDVIKKLTESTGTLEVNKTATTIQENSRVKRTLSSLRVPLTALPQKKEEISQNVWGVDTNNVVTATQNMTGLNIAA